MPLRKRASVTARLRTIFIGLAALVGLIALLGYARAGELTLKDGSVLRGSLETPAVLRGDNQATPGFIRIDDGLHRVLVHDKLREHWDDTTPLTQIKPFRIAQPTTGKNPNLVIGHIVSIVSISPFDEFGRRTFTARDARGENAIPQGITEINPEYIKVTSLKHVWDSSIATQSVPPAVVESILRKAIDPARVDDRLWLFRFFMAVEWFVQAENELKSIEQEFPKLDPGEIRTALGLLEEAKARRRLREIKLRRAAGQHKLAFELLREFPLDGASGEVIVEVRDQTKQYDNLIDRMHTAQRQIERLRGAIQDADLLTKISPPLEEILQFVDHVDGIVRLDNFLTVADKESITAENKLGAAISGWVTGNAFAEANIDRALLLWEGRGKIAQYLTETNESRRLRLLSELKGKETISVEMAAH